MFLFCKISKSVRTLVPFWDKIWKEEQKKVTGKIPSIKMVLLKGFKWDLIKAGFWQLSYVVFSLVSPQILNLVIKFVQNPSEPEWKGYLYTALLAVVALITAISDSRYYGSLRLVGQRIRTCLSCVVHRKTLKLSSSSRREQSAGEVVNLISVDCQKIEEAMIFINLLWACPLQVCLAIYFIYKQINWSVFVGKT